MIHGSPARFDIISASMARVPRFLDVSVALAPGIPTYPGNTPFEFEPVKRIANGDSSNVSRMSEQRRNLASVRSVPLLPAKLGSVLSPPVALATGC
jgi:hypothetical protein